MFGSIRRIEEAPASVDFQTPAVVSASVLILVFNYGITEMFFAR